MKITYRKLWGRLQKLNLNKGDLQRMTGMSSATIAKLAHGDALYTDSLVRICNALHCDINDIAEISTED